MMATTAPDLALAEAQGKLLSHSADTAEIEACLGVVSDASADLGRRAGLQSHLLFERLLEMYASLYATKPPPKSLLRCIGNLVSDNGMHCNGFACFFFLILFDHVLISIS